MASTPFLVLLDSTQMLMDSRDAWTAPRPSRTLGSRVCQGGLRPVRLQADICQLGVDQRKVRRESVRERGREGEGEWESETVGERGRGRGREREGERERGREERE